MVQISPKLHLLEIKNMLSLMATTLIVKVKEMLRYVSQKWHHELSQILRANVTSL